MAARRSRPAPCTTSCRRRVAKVGQRFPNSPSTAVGFQLEWSLRPEAVPGLYDVAVTARLGKHQVSSTASVRVPGPESYPTEWDHHRALHLLPLSGPRLEPPRRIVGRAPTVPGYRNGRAKSSARRQSATVTSS